MQQKAQQLQGQAGSVTDRFTENLSALREVRAYGLEKMEVARFERVSESMVKAQLKVAKYAQMLTPAIEIISALGHLGDLHLRLPDAHPAGILPGDHRRHVRQLRPHQAAGRAA